MKNAFKFLIVVIRIKISIIIIIIIYLKILFFEKESAGTHSLLKYVPLYVGPLLENLVVLHCHINGCVLLTAVLKRTKTLK